MNFIIFDIALLIIFVACISIFLFIKRKNLKREGLLFLYKTKIGVKIIERIGKKYTKLLNVLSYISIILGFLLMIGVLYFFGKIIWIYIFQAEIVKLATFELKDGTGEILVSAWRKHADVASSLRQGEKIIIKNVYVKRAFSGEHLEISTRNNTSIIAVD